MRRANRTHEEPHTALHTAPKSTEGLPTSYVAGKVPASDAKRVCGMITNGTDSIQATVTNSKDNKSQEYKFDVSAGLWLIHPVLLFLPHCILLQLVVSMAIRSYIKNGRDSAH